jgi:hypothetical protein
MKYKKAMLNETLSLEVKMKITNVILLIAFALLLVATTGLALKLTRVIEYTPHPFKEKFVGLTKRYTRISELEISGGYNIEVSMSKKDSLEFYGPDLLVKKYSVIEEQNGKLKIESKVNLAYYPYYLRIKLYVKDLERLSLKNGATINMWQIKGDSLEVIAKDSSLARISASEYKYAQLEAGNRAIISLEKTDAAKVSVKDQSMVVINISENGISGMLDKGATLIANGKKINHNVLIANPQNKRVAKK